jgi:hypothetical protein
LLAAVSEATPLTYRSGFRQGGEVSGERGCPFDGGSVGPGEDVAGVPPAGACRFAFLALLVAVLFEGVQAWRGQRDGRDYWARRKSFLLLVFGCALGVRNK